MPKNCSNLIFDRPKSAFRGLKMPFSILKKNVHRMDFLMDKKDSKYLIFWDVIFSPLNLEMSLKKP